MYVKVKSATRVTTNGRRGRRQLVQATTLYTTYTVNTPTIYSSTMGKDKDKDQIAGIATDDDVGELSTSS
jgi:hypothetical protein